MSCPPPMLRSDIMTMADLREGMELTGTVRNVIDFGAFVDIGVHQDGFGSYFPQLSDSFVKASFRHCKSWRCCKGKGS